MKITYSATSANIGQVLILDIYRFLKTFDNQVLEPADAWHIEHDLGDIPSDILYHFNCLAS